MIFVCGRVQRVIRNEDEEIDGLFLDDGRRVCFAVHVLPKGSSITPGCLIGIEGLVREDGRLGQCLVATSITNLDVRENTGSPALYDEGGAGMRSNTTPIYAASLPPTESVSFSNAETGPLRHGSDAAPQHPASFFHFLAQKPDAEGTNAARNEAARTIGLAYDCLHRIQAVLAYLHIMRHVIPGISQFLDEARHTYLQAVARFDAADFIGAKEFAKASGSLSRVVEIVMQRDLRSDGTLPSLVPPPPQELCSIPDADHVGEIFAQVESALSRIHWVLRHGTLPSEDRAQVRKITSWGDAFLRQARRTRAELRYEEASELAEAALSGADSAEHVCRKWYVNR